MPSRSPVSASAAEATLTGEHVQDIFSLARHNRIREVTALLDRGIPVDIQDKFGNTILIVASQNGLKRMAKLALRRGCDIDARNLKGNTALHFCHAYGYGAGLGAYLVDKGADESARNLAGFLPHEGLG
jgi:ankyrin repeat protein